MSIAKRLIEEEMEENSKQEDDESYGRDEWPSFPIQPKDLPNEPDSKKATN